MEMPVKIDQIYQLSKVGIDLANLSSTNVTMEAEKFIVCREKGIPGTLIIIDLTFIVQPLRLSTIADSVIMHPRQKLIAMKIGKIIQIFDIDKNKYVKKLKRNDDIVYWRWIDEDTICFVTKTSIFHWAVTGNSGPVKVIDIDQYLAAGRIVDYRTDAERRFSHIIGASSVVSSFVDTGTIDVQSGKSGFRTRLYDSLTSRPYFDSGYSGCCACFVTYKMDNHRHSSNLLVSFVMDRERGGLLCIEQTDTMSERQAVQDTFSQRSIRVDSMSPFTNDSPLAIQASEQLGIIYLVTELGFLHIFELETGHKLYRRRASEEPIFAVAGNSMGGITCINKIGQVFTVCLNKTAMIDHLMKRKGLKSANRSLARKLSHRWRIPFSDVQMTDSIRAVVLEAGEDPTEMGEETIKFVKNVVKEYKKKRPTVHDAVANNIPTNQSSPPPRPLSPHAADLTNVQPITPSEATSGRPLPARPCAPLPKQRTSVSKAPLTEDNEQTRDPLPCTDAPPKAKVLQQRNSIAELTRAEKAEKERDEIAVRCAELEMQAMLMNQEMEAANSRAVRERDEIAAQLAELEMKYRTAMILIGREGQLQRSSMSSQYVQSMLNLNQI